MLIIKWDHRSVNVRVCGNSSYRMDSKRAETLFKKNRIISNITLPTNLPLKPNPMLQRQRARRYSRAASLPYNASATDGLGINLSDSVDNDTDTVNETEKDLPFNKVIVQTPVQRNDMSYIISNLGHFQDYRIEVRPRDFHITCMYNTTVVKNMVDALNTDDVMNVSAPKSCRRIFCCKYSVLSLNC